MQSLDLFNRKKFWFAFVTGQFLNVHAFLPPPLICLKLLPNSHSAMTPRLAEPQVELCII